MFLLKIFPEIIFNEPGNCISGYLHRSSCGDSGGLCTGKIRHEGKGILKSVFLSPTIVPGIVIGFVLYQFLVLSLRIPVYAGLLAGHFMVTLPYVIRVVGSSLDQFDFSVEEAAWSLGCGKISAFLKWCFRISHREFRPPFMLAFINSF